MRNFGTDKGFWGRTQKSLFFLKNVKKKRDSDTSESLS